MGHAATAEAAPGQYIIVEGFQILHCKELCDRMAQTIYLNLEREECIHRRCTRSAHNPNPLSRQACELLLWPAHERYLRNCVNPLVKVGKVTQFRAPMPSLRAMTRLKDTVLIQIRK